METGGNSSVPREDVFYKWFVLQRHNITNVALVFLVKFYSELLGYPSVTVGIKHNIYRTHGQNSD